MRKALHLPLKRRYISFGVYFPLSLHVLKSCCFLSPTLDLWGFGPWCPQSCIWRCQCMRVRLWPNGLREDLHHDGQWGNVSCFSALTRLPLWGSRWRTLKLSYRMPTMFTTRLEHLLCSVITTEMDSEPFIIFLPTNQKAWAQQPIAFPLLTLAEKFHITAEVSACLPRDVCKVISWAAVNVPANYIWRLMLTICYL